MGAVGLLLVTDTINITSPLQPTERLKRLIILPKWKISPTGQRDDDVFRQTLVDIVNIPLLAAHNLF